MTEVHRPRAGAAAQVRASLHRPVAAASGDTSRTAPRTRKGGRALLRFELASMPGRGVVVRCHGGQAANGLGLERRIGTKRGRASTAASQRRTCG